MNLSTSVSRQLEPFVPWPCRAELVLLLLGYGDRGPSTFGPCCQKEPVMDQSNESYDPLSHNPPVVLVVRTHEQMLRKQW